MDSKLNVHTDEEIIKDIADLFYKMFSMCVIPSLDDCNTNYISVGNYSNEEPLYFIPSLLEIYQKDFYKLFKYLKLFDEDTIKECLSEEKYNDLMHKFDNISLASDSRFSDRYYERIDDYFDEVPRKHLCEIVPDKYSDDVKNDIKNKRNIISSSLELNEQRIINNLYFSHLKINTDKRRNYVFVGNDREVYLNYRRAFTPTDVNDDKLDFRLSYHYDNCLYRYRIDDDTHKVTIQDKNTYLKYTTTYDEYYYRSKVISSELYIENMHDSDTLSIATTTDSFSITSKVNEIDQIIKYKKAEELVYSVDDRNIIIKDNNVIVNDEIVISNISNESMALLIDNIACKEFMNNKIKQLITFKTNCVKDMEFFLRRTKAYNEILEKESIDDILTNEIMRRLESRQIEKEYSTNKEK